MGNVYMEADQVRFKDSAYRNVQEGLAAALEGGGGGGTTVVANPEGSATADLNKLQVGEGIYGIPATAAKISYDNTDSGLTADDVQDAIDEMVANFGDGVDEVYNACVSAGSTPTTKSPADIAAAIGNISGGGNIVKLHAATGQVTSGHLTETFTITEAGVIFAIGNTYSDPAYLKKNNDTTNYISNAGGFYWYQNAPIIVAENDVVTYEIQGSSSIRDDMDIYFAPGSIVVPNN